jgi:hypothetical protein
MPVQRLVAAAPAAVLLILSVAGAAQEPATAPSVSATPVAEPVVQDALAVPPPAPCCIVPARTPIDIEFVDTVNSRANNNGDRFAFRLAEPLIVDGQVVAPAGTPGVGEVVHAAHASFGGKAGELILAVRYLDLNGTRIPLRSLRYGPRQGRDNSGAVTAGAMVTAVVLPVASVLAFVISGGEVNIPAGTRANAMTSTEISLPPVE